MATGPVQFSGGNPHESGFTVQNLFEVINDAVVSARNQLQKIQANRSSISIGDMFEMQMIMNHLSQLSEMATDVVQSANSAIQSAARNIKG